MGGIFDFNNAAPYRPERQQDDRRIETLRAALKGAAPGLVRELFPLARYQGNEARIGSAQGEAGESMSIVLAGEKAGQWYDHNPTASVREGDLITLWEMGQGCSFMQAVDDLELHLGLRAGAKWTGPVYKAAQERAMIPRPPEPTKTLEATYRYLSADGSTVLAQVLRYRLSNGKKTFMQRDATGAWKSPEVRPLYNLPGIAQEHTVVLVEGEKCVERLDQLGVPATTAMGGSDTILDKTDWSPLAGKRVILWPDNDEAGRQYMARVADLLRARGVEVHTVSVPANMPEKWDAADAGDEEAVGLLHAAIGTPGQDKAGQASRSLRFVSVEELEDMPPPEWLVEGLLPRSAFGLVVGPPASLKTFVALDWGLSIATGQQWQEKAMGQGHVVYVAGEGHYGLGQRVIGWKRHREIEGELERFHIVPQAVAMPTGQVDELIALIGTLPEPPVLVILDTLARTFGGGDENSQKDMNAYVAAVDKLRSVTGAAALVIHHTGKDVERGARGSTVLMGAADMALGVKRSGEHLTLINKGPVGKQKDAEEHEDMNLRGAVYRFKTKRGEDASTIILMQDEPLIAPEQPTEPQLGDTQKRVLAMLQDAETRGLPGLGAISVATAACGGNTGNARKVLQKLVELGLAEEVEGVMPKMWAAV